MLNFFVLFYHVIFRPFESTAANIMAIINEVILVGVCIFLTQYIVENINDLWEPSGWNIIYIIGGMAGFNVIIILGIKVKDLCTMIRQKIQNCKDKKKAAN